MPSQCLLQVQAKILTGLNSPTPNRIARLEIQSTCVAQPLLYYAEYNSAGACGAGSARIEAMEAELAVTGHLFSGRFPEARPPERPMTLQDTPRMPPVWVMSLRRQCPAVCRRWLH